MQSDKPDESGNVQGTEATPPVNDDEPTREANAEPCTPEEDSTASNGPSEPQMPDPSALVAMAGMHLQTQQLLEVLLTVFHAHAWRSMGLVADHTGEIKKDLPSAQTSIDCLAFILSKVEGSLDDADRRDVQRRLTDLRMNYVAKVRET